MSWYEQLHALHGDDHRRKRASGMTWSSIAAELGVPERTLYDWAAGKPPSAAARAAIRKLYEEKVGPTGKEGNRRPRGAEGKE